MSKGKESRCIVRVSHRCPSLKDFVLVYSGCNLELDSDVLERVSRARMVYEALVKRKDVYGYSTGVGALQELRLDPREIAKRIVFEHASGTGNFLDPSISRLVVFARIYQLSRGYSPIRPEVLEVLVELLNHDIIPAIPRYGSVGASGDLAPLAHIALNLCGEGYVWYRGKLTSAIEALRSEGIRPIEFREGEALSLINGTAYSAGILMYVVMKVKALYEVWLRIASLTTSLITCNAEHYEPQVLKVKNYPNLVEIGNVYKQYIDCYTKQINTTSSRIQDPYSLRCSPYAFSAFGEVLKHVADVVLREICSPADNPIVIVDRCDVAHQCSFHGIYLGLAADYLAIAIAVLANVSERRITQLLNPEVNRVRNRPFLGDSGSPTGYMIAQYVAAARAAQLRHLASPQVVHNIPTSLLQEDFVSMSANAALRLLDMLDAAIDIASIELLLALRLIDILNLEAPREFRDLMNKISITNRPLSLAIGESRRKICELIENTIQELPNVQEYS